MAKLRSNSLKARSKALNRPKDFEASRGRAKRNQSIGHKRITDTHIERIVALSLQHPDFGARRLVPLLKKEKISLSPSTVYRILRRHGLQTRAKRMSRLKRQTAETTPIPKKPHASDKNLTESRVVALSLQNPDYGARRLILLLEKEKISLSPTTIYCILRRRGLHNRTLRISQLAEQQATAAPIADKADEPEAQNKVVAATSPVSLRQKKSRKKIFRKENWIFYCINMVLLALIGYYGLQANMNYRQFFLAPEIPGISAQALAAIRKDPENPLPPLEHYKGIWEGNLFKTSHKKNQAPKKIDETLLKSKPAPAEDHGLELRGTVVMDDSAQRVAVIYQQHANHQDTFKQGDRVGKVVIKKILREKVIINAGRGDELLTIDFDKSTPKKPPYEFKAASAMTPRIRHRKVNLDRKQFEFLLAKLDWQWDRLQFTPHLNDGQPDGIIIKGLKLKNLLFKMGVRNGDVIKGINEQEYQSPDQAEDIFYNFEQGNEYKIMLLRGKKPIELEVAIQ